MGKFITKAGQHGTLYRYAIRYVDRDDKCCPEFVWTTWAYSAEHAEEKFYDADDMGWRMISTARVLDGVSQHRAVQHAAGGES